MRFHIAIATAVALATIASCSTRDQPAQPPTSVPGRPEVLAVAAEISALRAQLDVHETSCMAAAGFPFFPMSAQEHYDSLVELYSLSMASLSVDQARTTGYDSTERSPSGSDEAYDYYESRTEAESAAYQAVRFGAEDERRSYSSPLAGGIAMPVGGCIGEAARSVYGSIDSYVAAEGVFYELQGLTGTLSVEVANTDAYENGIDAWAGCMSKAGVPFDDPSKARDAALATRSTEATATTKAGTDEGRPSRSTPGERRIAVADATCQEETDLPGIYSRVAAIEQARLTKKHEQVFLSWDELRRRIEREGYAGVTADADGLQAGTAGDP